MPPGALHQRVTAALANWRLDDAEELLADVERFPPPYVVPDPGSDTADADPAAGDPQRTLGRAWADTLRAELLVRRLRLAGFTLVGDPVDEADEPGLDLHAGVTDLIDRSTGAAAPTPGTPGRTGTDGDGRGEQASRAALAIALVRSAKAAFDAADDDLQRAAGLARHARIELLSRRIDAAMDEAVEAASLLDPGLEPGPLLVDTLGTLAAVLADLELMPLALDYQRRALLAATAAAERPRAPEDGDPRQVVATAAVRLGELCAELGEGLLDDGTPEAARSHFTEARALAERALGLLGADEPLRAAALVVHGWALVGLEEHRVAARLLREAVRATTAADDRALLASARLALGRALRRQGDPGAADEHLAAALDLATEHGLPRLRRSALRELCTLHAELDDAGRALPYLQAYLADELDRVDERRTRWVELFDRRKNLLETERAAGQLRRQAYEDPLTHLPNRRYAEARLDGLLTTGAAPALAVVDVDRFKEVNDAIGHPGGDEVLRRVAEVLVAGCRDTDEVCRWAGDEFVILLPDTTAEQAERALERCRRALAAHDWAALGLPEPVTISVGIASAARGDDRRTLFAAADGVLYDAKRSGRDRVVRLSGVTQTRTGADAGSGAGTTNPGTAGTGAAETGRSGAGTAGTGAAGTGAAGTGAAGPAAPGQVPPQELRGTVLPPDDARGFGALLVEPVDPPLGTDRPGEPLLGPLPPWATARDDRPAPADRSRPARVEPEVVWGTGRSTEQVLALVREARRDHPHRPTVVLRAAPETLVAVAGEHDAYTTMDAAAMAAAVGPVPEPVGRIAVLSTAGDAPVAAETAFVARVAGTEVVRVDAGSGRLPALLADRTLLPEVDCLVVVTGADAALAGLLGTVTDVPVLAVPTSTGTPGALGGLGAVLAVLGSPAPGVAVTAVDDGWSAGVFAARVARR
ncbi:diguanylate cyclase [Geodermatophilus sp. YIM 151500]|uniref:diguanylate cyclase domain-containing protein n=1 Tax=Geodermatophilus sp. YIM 151500 TaxID=2984531 RepID=UPI0021E42EF5|nr:diguanylate cyclase [Geodermatophilus sp. YIM 151500]MCV2490574.1 diguanylate cyclase [Geodermatophilus sp. YIM 151500]